MGHDPLGVHAVAMEAAAELVVDAAAAHPLQGPVDDPADLGIGCVVPPVQQEGDRARMGELRLAAEPAVDPVEHRGHLAHRAVEQCRRGLAGSGFVERGIEDAPDGVGLGRHLIPAGAVGVEHSGQHGAKAGSAVLPVGREVGPAVEDFAGRGEEGGERPAALPGDRLDGVLVAGVDVGALVPIHLDADEVLVEELGQVGILVRLPVHHVTPVAPDRADVEEHRLVGAAGGGEGLLSPGIPMDRLVGGGAEIGGAGRAEAVGGHAGR